MTDSLAKLNLLLSMRERDVLVDRFSKTSFTLEQAFELIEQAQLCVDYAAALKVAELQAAMMRTPIIAVLGELNAGKSSVVASFLSDGGRQRVPRGVAGAQGTHRFVYWVPLAWQTEPALREAFEGFLAAAHGASFEYLSDDPAVAAVQYQSGRDDPAKIPVPLVAYDAALTQVAFLDCPDVQTDDKLPHADQRHNPRLEFVANAARLCSAFLLIWERAKLRDRLLAEFVAKLRSRMAQVPLYLLVNKVRPERGQPDATLNDADLQRIEQQFGLSGIYIAYDFDIEARGDEPGWRELTPAALAAQLTNESRFPLFFRPAGGDGRRSDANQLPSPCPLPGGEGLLDDSFLSQIPRQLDPAAVQQQAICDHVGEAYRLVGKGLAHIEQWVIEQNAKTQQVHTGLLTFCVGRFTDPKDGEPRQIPDQQFTLNLSKSFYRTAPWYLKMGLKLRGKFQGAVSLVQETASRARQLLSPGQLRKWLLGGGGTAAEEFAKLGLAGGQIEDAASLASNMHALRWVPAEIDEQRLKAAWDRALVEFSRFKLPASSEELDEMTADFWKSLSAWQSLKTFVLLNLFAVMGAVAAVGGVLLAAIDGGATLLASYSLAESLATLIPGGAAIGVAAIGAGAAFAGFMGGAIAHNTLPALSALFCLACDAFGVPRRLNDQPIYVTFGKRGEEQKFMLPSCSLPVLTPVCPLPSLGIWQSTDGAKQYQQVIDRGN